MRNLDWLPHTDDSLAVAAEVYAAHGWAVFPLVPRGKLPLIAKADGGNGFHDATTDVEQVRAQWKRTPLANIGFALRGNLVALDVDGGDGLAERHAIEVEHEPLPLTTRAITGSDSEHWIFTDERPNELRQDVKFRPGLDTRCADRGYIIVAPSVHPCGGLYRWHTCVAPAPLPAWLRAMIVKPTTAPRKVYVPPAEPLPGHMQKRERYARGVLRGVCADIAGTARGGKGASGRNNALNKAWWRVQQFRDAVSLDEARAALTDAALSCGLDEREIEKVLR
jgi:hypothetical protein